MNNKYPIWKKFFVLEGLDGSGTTSQLVKLEKHAETLGLRVHATCEPTEHPLGKMLRKILHKDLHVEPETMARLFTADRYEHLYGNAVGIKTHLDKGETIICDRYLFSSLAYQSLGCDFDTILNLNSFPLPEMVIYIDVPPEECVNRRSERDKEELFDAISLQESLRCNYFKAFNTFSNTEMKLQVIDGTRSIEEVFKQICGLIFN